MRRWECWKGGGRARRRQRQPPARPTFLLLLAPRSRSASPASPLSRPRMPRLSRLATLHKGGMQGRASPAAADARSPPPPPCRQPAHLEPPSLEGPLLTLAARPDGAMAGGWRLSRRQARVQSRRRLCVPPAAAHHPGRHLGAAAAASAPAKSRVTPVRLRTRAAARSRFSLRCAAPSAGDLSSDPSHCTLGGSPGERPLPTPLCRAACRRSCLLSFPPPLLRAAPDVLDRPETQPTMDPYLQNT